MNRRLPPWLWLAALTGLNLFNYLDRYVLSGVLTPLKAELSLSDGDLGRIQTIFMIGYFVTSPLFGFLGDRIARKWLIAAGIFVWSVGTVFTGWANGLAELLFFRVLVGVGEASYATTSPALISDLFPPKARNNALTIFYVAIPVGAALGYILGGQVAAHQSWRHAFFWAGAPGLLLAFSLLPFREPRRGESEGRADSPEFQKKPRFSDVPKLFRIRNFSLVVAGYTAYTFAMGAYGYWGPTFLHRIHHIPNSEAATFFGAVLVVAGLVGTLVGGFAATSFQRKNPAGYAWVLGVSVLLAVPASFVAFLSADPLVSRVCLAAAMFLLFLCTGPVNTVMIESVPVNLRSSAMALSIFMIHLFGDLWSPEIVGRLADRWHDLQKAILILPTALALGGLLWLLLAILQQRELRKL